MMLPNPLHLPRSDRSTISPHCSREYTRVWIQYFHNRTCTIDMALMQCSLVVHRKSPQTVTPTAIGFPIANTISTLYLMALYDTCVEYIGQYCNWRRKIRNCVSLFRLEATSWQKMYYISSVNYGGSSVDTEHSSCLAHERLQGPRYHPRAAVKRQRAARVYVLART